MKILPILLTATMLLTACQPSPKGPIENNSQPTTIGADRDRHGCIGTAGYTWSEVKQDCVQLFNIGFRLKPVHHAADEAVISAFVLMSEDQSKAELFLPDTDGPSLILNKSVDGTFRNHSYVYDANTSNLYYRGRLSHKGNVE